MNYLINRYYHNFLMKKLTFDAQLIFLYLLVNQISLYISIQLEQLSDMPQENELILFIIFEKKMHYLTIIIYDNFSLHHKKFYSHMSCSYMTSRNVYHPLLLYIVYLIFSVAVLRKLPFIVTSYIFTVLILT